MSNTKERNKQEQALKPELSSYQPVEIDSPIHRRPFLSGALGGGAVAWPASEGPAAVGDGAIHVVLVRGGTPHRVIICVSCLAAAHLYCVHVFAGGL